MGRPLSLPNFCCSLTFVLVAHSGTPHSDAYWAVLSDSQSPCAGCISLCRIVAELNGIPCGSLTRLEINRAQAVLMRPALSSIQSRSGGKALGYLVCTASVLRRSGQITASLTYHAVRVCADCRIGSLVVGRPLSAYLFRGSLGYDARGQFVRAGCSPFCVQFNAASLLTSGSRSCPAWTPPAYPLPRSGVGLGSMCFNCSIRQYCLLMHRLACDFVLSPSLSAFLL